MTEEEREDIISMGIHYAERFHMCPLAALNHWWNDPEITPSPKHYRSKFWSTTDDQRRAILSTIGDETDCMEEMIYHGL